MRRELDMSEISDGRYYKAGDMVRIGCNDCSDCSECCRSVGNSIILDPYDVIMLGRGLGIGFEEMIKSGRLELRVVDGIIQPNLKISEQGGCSFLSEEGRCTIHNIRPGFCRLFPLGRIYEEDGSFSYFIQVNECSHPNKTKVKIRQWLGIDRLDQYEKWVTAFHNVLIRLRRRLAEQPASEQQLNMRFLQHFYLAPYSADGDIYEELNTRLQAWQD